MSGTSIETGSTAKDCQPWQDYKTVFTLSPDMICIAEKCGKLLEVNPACTRVLGFAAEEMIGGSWEDFIHPDDIDITRQQVAGQLAGQGVLNFVNRYRTKAGAYRVLEWQGLFTDARFFVGTARDITEETRRNELLASLAQNERKSVRAALHDGISQQLFGLRMLAKQLRMALEKSNPGLFERAACMEQITHETLKSVRGIMEGLTPCENHGGNLIDALRCFAERIQSFYGIRCFVELDMPDLDLHTDIANQLCLILQEAVINAVKHAHANLITIKLERMGALFSATVTDDGKGLRRASDSGYGFTIMRERACLIDADLAIAPGEEGGTVVRCTWMRASSMGTDCI